jgi:signal transduction histidine kinase
MQVHPTSPGESTSDGRNFVTVAAEYNDALFMVDELGHCSWANNEGAALLRVQPGELPRSAFWDLAAERLDGAPCAAWRSALSTRVPVILGEYRTPTGRCFACRSFPSTAGAWVCLVDVTAKDSALRAAIEERSHMEAFVGVLAHELTNPLSTLVNGITLLKIGKSDIDRIKLLNVLEKQLRHFVNIVDDLFDVSALARDQVHMRKAPVEVDALIPHAVGAVAELAEKKQHRIEIGPTCGAVVHGDFTRLSQALINLLKNSIWYTPPGGQIRINTRITADQVEISVADNGRGITPDRLPHVFDRVYEHRKGDSQSPAGLGIGLGLVQRIAELHGGSVVAHSEGQGRGSEFTMRLPPSAQARSNRQG